MRKRGGKSIICCFVYLLVRDEKPPKPNQEKQGGKPDTN